MKKLQFSVKNLRYKLRNYRPWANRVDHFLPRIFAEQECRYGYSVPKSLQVVRALSMRPCFYGSIPSNFIS